MVPFERLQHLKNRLARLGDQLFACRKATEPNQKLLQEEALTEAVFIMYERFTNDAKHSTPKLELDESDRQMVLMALAHLSVSRPGWDDALNRIALRIDNMIEGRADLYDRFRKLKADEKTEEAVRGLATAQALACLK
jgi:hypothetical protein